MPMKASTTEIYRMLQKHGYNIEVNQSDQGKLVRFTSKHATSYQLPRSYHNEWADHEIVRDCVQELLAWANMRVTFTLEYN